jgi:hypothetical protein
MTASAACGEIRSHGTHRCSNRYARLFRQASTSRSIITAVAGGGIQRKVSVPRIETTSRSASPWSARTRMRRIRDLRPRPEPPRTRNTIMRGIIRGSPLRNNDSSIPRNADRRKDQHRVQRVFNRIQLTAHTPTHLSLQDIEIAPTQIKSLRHVETCKGTKTGRIFR